MFFQHFYGVFRGGRGAGPPTQPLKCVFNLPIEPGTSPPPGWMDDFSFPRMSGETNSIARRRAQPRSGGWGSYNGRDSFVRQPLKNKDEKSDGYLAMERWGMVQRWSVCSEGGTTEERGEEVGRGWGLAPPEGQPNPPPVPSDPRRPPGEGSGGVRGGRRAPAGTPGSRPGLWGGGRTAPTGNTQKPTVGVCLASRAFLNQPPGGGGGV